MSVKVRDVAFVRFDAPDLAAMEAFLTAFGMTRAERDEHTLYMRGTDDEGFVHVTHLGETPRFAGVAFEAGTADDLDTLARDFEFSEPGALDGPGGVRLLARPLRPHGRALDRR